MKNNNGILVVDKPSDWTSNDVVQKVKNILGRPKVGHTGTLDPMATGVLILLIGKSTKTAPFYENNTKRYVAEVTFGYSTDSYDRTGKTVKYGDPGLVSMEKLNETIANLKGESEQVPPIYSAVKVNGKRLYKLARAGKTIERQPKTITIHSIASDCNDFPRIMLNIECSKGTYIRSIAQQLGETVGCPAHLSSLRRTAAGNYTIDDAIDFLNCIEAGDSDSLEKHIIQPEIPVDTL